MLNESICEDAIALARTLYPGKKRRQLETAEWLIETAGKVEDVNVVIVHSPGGWGNAAIADLIDWERSIVDGIEAKLDESGTRWVLVQYFRSGNSFWDKIKKYAVQTWYALTGKIYLAPVMARQLQFLKEHFPSLKIVLIGVSMGAAFNNTVMNILKNNSGIFSIELGIVFFHRHHRVITERTLAIDSNGFKPDPVVYWDVIKAAWSYFTAPYRWLRYRIEGNPQKFTYCINVPGHEYRWEFPAVGERIREFLNNGLKLETRDSKLVT